MDNFTRAMFGCHAMHISMQLILQEVQSSPNGKHIVSAVALISSPEPILSQFARDNQHPHELIVGDAIIRPVGRWSDRDHVGSGLTAMITSGAMFPDDWEHQNLDNGYSKLVSAGHYKTGGELRG